MLRRFSALRFLVIALLVPILGGIETAWGAPALLTDFSVDGNIIFAGPGQGGARDIRTEDSQGGLRFFNGSALTVTPSGAAIQFFGNESNGFPGQAFIDSGAHNSAAVIFRTAQTSSPIMERMRVAANGNVGIGTNNPTELLYMNAGNKISNLSINSDGNGVGGAGQAALQLRQSGSAKWAIQTQGDEGDLNILEADGNGSRIYIKGGGTTIHGNVGLGTTTPQSKLQVVGDYIQIPAISGAPSATDCDVPDEVGRMVIRTDGSANLYICLPTGWVSK
jgi:hypothetical protein